MCHPLPEPSAVCQAVRVNSDRTWTMSDIHPSIPPLGRPQNQFHLPPISHTEDFCEPYLVVIYLSFLCGFMVLYLFSASWSHPWNVLVRPTISLELNARPLLMWPEITSAFSES